jgi:hypothetical protein
MELTEKTIVEIYDRIMRNDDMFGIKEIVRSDSYRKTFSLMSYVGAYRELAADYTAKFGYDTMNEFLKRSSNLLTVVKLASPIGKPEVKVLPNGDVQVDADYDTLHKAITKVANDSDTEEIDFGDVVKAMEESFSTAE